MKALPHPPRAKIALPAVLDALSDETRLAIVARLAADGERVCSEFLSLGSKTNLSYHLAKLREAGVVRVRQDGVFRHLSLRWEDLEARFPGLMQSLLAAAKRDGVATARRKSAV